jgi:hypothetical protein
MRQEASRDRSANTATANGADCTTGTATATGSAHRCRDTASVE